MKVACEVVLGDQIMVGQTAQDVQEAAEVADKLEAKLRGHKTSSSKINNFMTNLQRVFLEDILQCRNIEIFIREVAKARVRRK